MSEVRVDPDERMAKKRHYEIDWNGEFDRYMLIRQPDALVIDSGPAQLPLIELQRDIERRIAKNELNKS